MNLLILMLFSLRIQLRISKIQDYGKNMMNSEKERIWKEAAVAYFMTFR